MTWTFPLGFSNRQQKISREQKMILCFLCDFHDNCDEVLNTSLYLQFDFICYYFLFLFPIKFCYYCLENTKYAVNGDLQQYTRRAMTQKKARLVQTKIRLSLAGKCSGVGFKQPSLFDDKNSNKSSLLRFLLEFFPVYNITHNLLLCC